MGGSLGLTDTEHRIFNEILFLGESPLGDVIKRLGLHKGTAYNSIRRLENKGLVSFKNIKGVNVYSVNILALKKICSDEDSSHQSRMNEIKEVITKAETIKNLQKNTKVDILLGNEGFKSFFDDLYEWAYRTKKEYFFIGKGNEMIEHFGLDYYRHTQEKKKKLKLKCRVILSEASINLPVSKFVVGDIRYLHTEHRSPSSIWIYGNRLVLVLWDSKPITTVVIDSKEASISFKTYFEHLWQISQATKVGLIRSKEDYARWLVQILKDDEIKLICSERTVPFSLLYPEDEKEFIDIRKKINKKRNTLAGANESTLNIFKAQRARLKEGKMSKFLVWSDAVDWHLNFSKKILGKKYPLLLKTIKERASAPNIRIRSMTSPFPYYLCVSNKRVLTFTSFANTVSGIVIDNKETVKMYSRLFDSLYNQASELELK